MEEFLQIALTYLQNAAKSATDPTKINQYQYLKIQKVRRDFE